MLESGCPRGGDSLSAFSIPKALSSLAALLLGGNLREKYSNALQPWTHGLPLLFVSSNTISSIQAILVGFPTEFLQAKLLLAAYSTPSSPVPLRLGALIYPGSKSGGCRLSTWLMLFLTRRANLSRSCVRFNRRKCSCHPVSFFGCLSNTLNIEGTSCVFWMVTSASIHSAELFAKERLARFPAQDIGRGSEEEEEAGNNY